MMDKYWFQKLFNRPAKDGLKSTQAEADRGDAEAQCRLGLIFALGNGTPPDYAQAAHWYLKAASQNNASAQFNLGIMFTEGQGMPKDDDQAMRWIQEAAQQGHAGAQHNLGTKYRRASYKAPPDDALESNLKAYKWFRLAAAQGHLGSRAASEGIALGLTREQVSEGNHRAATFIAVCPAPISQ